MKTLFENHFEFNDFFFKLFDNKQIIYINFNDYFNVIINENVIINIDVFEIEKSKKIDESIISHSK